MFGRCPKFIRTLCPKPQIYLNFIELIQEKQRFAQVSAAANRAASRPGQAFTLLKNKRAVETARRCQVQAPGTFHQAFLQMPQMTGGKLARKGKIVESGTHEELWAAEGAYRRLLGQG